MTKYIPKIFHFTQFEKEQQWLQKKADEGWALKKKYLYSYVFEKTEAGEYQVRSEYVSSYPSQDYLDFLDDQKIEYLGKFADFIFLRRKSSEGPFELFTDRSSQLEYMKKLRRYHLFSLLLLLPMVLILYRNFSDLRWMDDRATVMAAVFLAALYALIILLMGSSMIRVLLRIRKIREEIRLYE